MTDAKWYSYMTFFYKQKRFGRFINIRTYFLLNDCALNHVLEKCKNRGSYVTMGLMQNLMLLEKALSVGVWIQLGLTGSCQRSCLYWPKSLWTALQKLVKKEGLEHNLLFPKHSPKVNESHSINTWCAVGINLPELQVKSRVKKSESWATQCLVRCEKKSDCSWVPWDVAVFHFVEEKLFRLLQWLIFKWISFIKMKHLQYCCSNTEVSRFLFILGCQRKCKIFNITQLPGAWEVFLSLLARDLFKSEQCDVLYISLLVQPQLILFFSQFQHLLQ